MQPTIWFTADLAKAVVQFPPNRPQDFPILFWENHRSISMISADVVYHLGLWFTDCMGDERLK